MGKYEYKVIPTPRKGKRAKGAKTPADRFASVLTDAINLQAAEGWEFVRSETLPMEAKPGLFKKSVETFQTVIVFRREIPGAIEDVKMTSAPAPIVPPISASRDEPVPPVAELSEPPLTSPEPEPVAPVPPLPEPAQANDPIKDAVKSSKSQTSYWD